MQSKEKSYRNEHKGLRDIHFIVTDTHKLSILYIGVYNVALNNLLFTQLYFQSIFFF